jgi:ParB-like chromosome segregation protein Spo0J
MSRNTSDTATIWAPLAQVRISERRLRSVSQSTVERYRSWLEQGREPPPLRLARQGDGYVVRDGRHRVAAALAAGHTVVKAQVCRIATMARAAFRRRSRNLRASTHTWG